MPPPTATIRGTAGRSRSHGRRLTPPQDSHRLFPCYHLGAGNRQMDRDVALGVTLPSPPAVRLRFPGATMGLVATVIPSQLRLNRLGNALRERHTVLPCPNWDDLLKTCATQPVSIAVVDLLAGGQTMDSFDALRQLKRRFPSVTFVLYTSVPPAQPRDLFEAGRFGLDGIIVADADDDPRRLVSIIEQAQSRGVLELLRPALLAAKPTVRDATLLAVTRAHQRLTPDSLARILGIRRKALSERLTQSGFPAAQRLIAWGRLIVAARMLEDPERSADSVALALDFPSGSAFRNACQRYVRAAPHQIRARGGAPFVVDCFFDRVRTRTMAPKSAAEPTIAIA